MSRLLNILLVVMGLGLLLTAVQWLIRPLPTNIQTEPFTGVKYSRIVKREPRPLMLHIVEIDLTAEGIGFVGTTGDLSLNPAYEFWGKTTGSFLEEAGAQIAVNGGFFYPFYETTPWDYYPKAGEPVNVDGLSMAHGVVYSPVRNRWAVLCINGTTVTIERDDCPTGTEQAVAGSVMLLRDGRIPPRLQNKLNPRTAVALDAAGETMWLVVVDGRQRWYSEGMTLTELAELLQDLGAHNALNLDGGGSTTLVMMEKDGRSQTINAPIHTRIPMRQRPVANHLGVFANPVQDD